MSNFGMGILFALFALASLALGFSDFGMKAMWFFQAPIWGLSSFLRFRLHATST